MDQISQETARALLEVLAEFVQDESRECRSPLYGWNDKPTNKWGKARLLLVANGYSEMFKLPDASSRDFK